MNISPEKKADFALETLNGIKSNIQENGRVTDKQISAIQNIKRSTQ